MRSSTHLVFDNVISGTANGPWYSAAEFNRVIGAADYYAVQTYATSVTPNSRLTVVSEMSGDSQNWIATGNTEINSQVIDNPTTASAAGGNVTGYIGAHMRFKITLGGVSNAGCRLKLYVTCRNSAT